MASPNFFSQNAPSGVALGNLVNSLYNNDTEGKRAERQAIANQKNTDAELKRVLINEHLAKKDASANADAQRADATASLIANLFGGKPQGEAVTSYRNAGGMQNPSVAGRPPMDDEGNAMPDEPMPRPSYYTPDAEKTLNARLSGIDEARIIGDKNVSHIATAQGSRQGQGIIEAALQGLLTPQQQSDVAGARSKPVYHEGAAGDTMNLFTGMQDQKAPLPQAHVAEIGAKAGKEGAQAAQARAVAGKVTSETLPQISVPAPEGMTTPTGTVPLRGADVSKAITKPAAAANAKGWKMFTDTDGTNYRVNENAGLVQKKAGAGWEDIDTLPAGTTHIGSNLGVKDNVRTSLVLGGAQNALDRMKEAEKKFGSTAVLRGSPYVGKHPKGVVSEVMHGIGREMIPEEQLNKDTYITGIVDEAIPVFTGGLRSSDSFRDFLMSQLPRTVGDNDVTTKEKWDVFKKNITGQSNAFRNKFNSTPSFHATGETGRTSTAAPTTSAPAAGGVKFLGFEK